MLRIPSGVRVFVATRRMSCAANVDDLVHRVRSEVGADPLSGDIFCFFNHRRRRVTLLV